MSNTRSGTRSGTSSGVTPEEVLLPDNEPLHVTSLKVVCDGGSGPLGHPRIYMVITGSEIECPYCSRRFILEPGAGGGH